MASLIGDRGIDHIEDDDLNGIENGGHQSVDVEPSPQLLELDFEPEEEEHHYDGESDDDETNHEASKHFSHSGDRIFLVNVEVVGRYTLHQFSLVLWSCKCPVVTRIYLAVAEGEEGFPVSPSLNVD